MNSVIQMVKRLACNASAYARHVLPSAFVQIPQQPTRALPRLPPELWGLVFLHLPISSAVAMVTTSTDMLAVGRSKFAPVVPAALEVPFSSVSGPLCAFRAAHVRVTSLQELIQLYTMGRRVEHLHVDFDASLDGVSWPPGLRRLRLGNAFNHPVSSLQLPDGLEELQFEWMFNQSVNQLKLAEGLRRLRFRGMFNQAVDGLRLPSSLQELHFGLGFNQPVDALLLGPEMEELRFGDWFNRPVECLAIPASLRDLHFGEAFTHPTDTLKRPGLHIHLVDRVRLPVGLHHINFGLNFNQPIVQIPAGLHHINFGLNFNQPIVQIPAGLHHINLDHFNQQITHLDPGDLNY
jgi:hypothetical protein